MVWRNEKHLYNFENILEVNAIFDDIYTIKKLTRTYLDELTAKFIIYTQIYILDMCSGIFFTPLSKKKKINKCTYFYFDWNIENWSYNVCLFFEICIAIRPFTFTLVIVQIIRIIIIDYIYKSFIKYKFLNIKQYLNNITINKICYILHVYSLINTLSGFSW